MQQPLLRTIHIHFINQSHHLTTLCSNLYSAQSTFISSTNHIILPHYAATSTPHNPHSFHQPIKSSYHIMQQPLLRTIHIHFINQSHHLTTLCSNLYSAQSTFISSTNHIISPHYAATYTPHNPHSFHQPITSSYHIMQQPLLRTIHIHFINQSHHLTTLCSNLYASQSTFISSTNHIILPHYAATSTPHNPHSFHQPITSS